MFDVRELNIAIELWGVAFCVLGILCATLFSSVTEQHRRLLTGMFALELLANGGDALAGFYRGNAGTMAWFATHAGNFATFAGNLLLSAALTYYVSLRLEESGVPSRYRLARAALLASLGMCLLTALGAFYHIDEANLYHRTNLYPYTLIYAVVVCLANAFNILGHRRSLPLVTLFCLLFYTIAPLVAMALQVAVYGLNFLSVANVTGMVILFLDSRSHSARLLIERTEELARAQVEASESRIQAMVSQIQPHFLFNTLDSIYLLCEEDPARAQTAVDMFSTYLRTNLDSLRRVTPVPIETELAHVRTYLELEQLSMEDQLVWEIRDAGASFAVPTLAVQTLVENAVKHGVSKRQGGGRIEVSTGQDAECWIVSIVDDGVGFDASAPISEGHVGLENTQARLAQLCGGTLDVVSTPGSGTTATIRIPKRGAQ